MRTDELIDYQRCPVCKDTLAECKCPECQCCGETGNPQCGINRIATLEARVRELEGALKQTVWCMDTQEKRETEEFHLVAHAFKPLWDKAKQDALTLLSPATATGAAGVERLRWQPMSTFPKGHSKMAWCGEDNGLCIVHKNRGGTWVTDAEWEVIPQCWHEWPAGPTEQEIEELTNAN